MLQRLWEHIGDLIVFSLISLAFGIIKLVTLPEPDNWKQALGSLLLSVIVGTLAGGLALQYALGDYTAITISSVSSLLARDIVLGILKNRETIGATLKRGLNQLVDKFTR